jgi:hypothetical protein
MKSTGYAIAVALLTVSSQAVAAWKYSVQTDPVTKDTTHFAYTVSLSEIAPSGRPVFMLRCEGSSLKALINWRSYVGGRVGEPLLLQVDKGKVMHMQLVPSADGAGTFLRDHADDSGNYTLRELLDQMRRGERVLAKVSEVRDFQRDKFTATFSLAGSDRAIREVMAKCDVGPN